MRHKQEEEMSRRKADKGERQTSTNKIHHNWWSRRDSSISQIKIIRQLKTIYNLLAHLNIMSIYNTQDNKNKESSTAPTKLHQGKKKRRRRVPSYFLPCCANQIGTRRNQLCNLEESISSAVKMLFLVQFTSWLLLLFWSSLWLQFGNINYLAHE